MELQGVLVARLQALVARPEVDGLRDLVLHADTLRDTIGEDAAERGVGSLHVIDDGDGHLLASGYDADAAVERGCLEEVHRRVSHALCRGVALYDAAVQARGRLVGGQGSHLALSPVAPSVHDGDGLPVGDVGQSAVVEPQGLWPVAAHGVVEVERALHGDAGEGDAAHVDARVGVDVATLGMGHAVGIGINLHVELRQRVLEGELQLLVDAVGMLDVEPGVSLLHRLGVVVARLELAPGGLIADAPAEVDTPQGRESGDVLHERVAGLRIGREPRDTPGVLALHVARSCRGVVHVGRVGEEGQLVLVVAHGVGARLVGPVHQRGVLPAAGVIEHSLVVHEVGDVRLVVPLQVGVVGEHTEAAAVGLRGLQTVNVEYAGLSGPRHAAVRVGIETHRVLAVGRHFHLAGAGAVAEQLRLTAGAGCQHGGQCR